jgi:RimJ/RimL family protein N-acetyltransferase
MPPHPLGPPYRIVTPRLVLRCWEPADAPARSAVMERNLDRPGLRRRLRGDEGEPKSPADRLAEIRRMRARFDLDEMWSYAVLTAGDGTLAGSATLFRVPPAGVELGLTAWCGEEHDGQGYEAEAAAALARTAYELLDAPRLYAACPEADANAAALFRTLGFTLDGTERHLDGAGARRDQLLWSLLPGEWPASPALSLAADASAFGALGDRLF